MRILLISLLIFFLTSCVITLDFSGRKKAEKMLKGYPGLSGTQQGLILFDPNKNKYLFRYNPDKLFIPASVIKLFTFYITDKILPDSLPSFRYCIYHDTLYFSGTGDPTFLHPDFPGQPAFDFLTSTSLPVVYVPAISGDTRFGPGWAWDDYPFYYSAEKSTFPVYGNSVWVSYFPGDSAPEVNPPYFKNKLRIHPGTTEGATLTRDEKENIFYLGLNPGDSIREPIPMVTSHELLLELLKDTLHREIKTRLTFPSCAYRLVYGHPYDRVMKGVLHESDNFIAEQLLMNASILLSDTLGTSSVIGYANDHFFTDQPPPERWVDGSGLSRYNLLSPETITSLLTRMNNETGYTRLRDLIPSPVLNQDTLDFIYAKPGSMTGVYNLAGFLETRKGKTLLFCFMFNNFTRPVREIRRETLELLKEIRDIY